MSSERLVIQYDPEKFPASETGEASPALVQELEETIGAFRIELDEAQRGILAIHANRVAKSEIQKKGGIKLVHPDFQYSNE